MRSLLLMALLGGCDIAFGFETLASPDELCLGGNGQGGGGLFEICLTAQPPATLEDIDINTGMLEDRGDCTEIAVQGDQGRTEVCVVAARNIEIDAVVLTEGRRPLVLAAVETLTITSRGMVSVASGRGFVNGAGSSWPGCVGASEGQDATALSGGAGGAGGSFQTPGAPGGTGIGAETNAVPMPELEPAFVRGGCAGGSGGEASRVLGGVRGAGGGAVYLMAGDQIMIAGTVRAYGEGGGGGQAGLPNMSGGGGGGGGGSGGLIGIDAPLVLLETTAKLVANGGGGGGGGSSTQPGSVGGDSDINGSFPFAASGGAGGSNNAGGRGGDGATRDAAAQPGSNHMMGAGGAGGGGGGGGLGYIKLYALDIDDRGASITPAP